MAYCQMDEIKKNSMKILVLGSGSFAGQAIFSNFISKGYEVFGINRSKPKNEVFWEWLTKLDVDIKRSWFTINIHKEPERTARLIEYIDPTHIVDLMGQGMVAPSWNDPTLWYETNISRKTYILETIRKLKNLEKYVRAGTPEVFGSSKEKLKEEAPFNPSTPYAVSHAAIDFHIRCLGKNYNFPYSIGRFSNFYGEGQQLYRVIPKAILCSLNKKKFIIDGDGQSLRSFIYTTDFVNAIEKLLFKSKPISEYNFSSNEEVSILQLIKIICKETQAEFNNFVSFGPERPGKDQIYRLNCNKAISDLNWSNKKNLNFGIKKVFNWISNNLDYLSTQSWNYNHKC